MIRAIAPEEPRRGRGIGLVLVALLSLGCGDRMAPTRGIVLISLDTLRADHLGCYGYARDTSPFLDQLAGRGVLFEQAIAQYPSTMTSHMSIFTGLYPAEHGVLAPNGVLADSIPTLPEMLRDGGFRTAGYTEAGQMRGEHGFSRGFERFDDRVAGRPDDVVTTFARGVDFLRSLAPGERFFLFLHTYAIHTPYDPPAPYDTLYTSGPPTDALRPTGRHILYLNSRRISPEPAVTSYYEALYDGSIRQVDDQLRSLFAEVEALRLANEITWIVTSDHGEEFLEHGRLAHTQIYRETVHVPLLVVSPAIRAARRIPFLVESIDLAPTVLELSGVEVPRMSGRSLRPWLAGRRATPRGHAYSEVTAAGTPVRSLHREFDSGRFQLVRTRLSPDQVRERIAEFDLGTAGGEIGLQSFRGAPRRVDVSIDGRPFANLHLEGDVETKLVLPSDPTRARRRVHLEADSCTPREAGRPYLDCLSFRLTAPHLLRRLELFRLDDDPLAQREVWDAHPSVGRRLVRMLATLRWRPRASHGEVALDDEARRQLEALGYL